MLRNSYRKEIGKVGEEIATDYLIKKRYKILNRNFYCRLGEIDIIAEKQQCIVFIEVKTRSNEKYGKPIEAITIKKKEHLKKTARLYLYRNNKYNNLVRFDAIEVLIKNGRYEITHIKQIL